MDPTPNFPKISFKKLSILTIITIIIGGICLYILSIGINRPHGGFGGDSPKISAVRQLQLALELYANQHEKMFPQAPEGCQNAQVLERELTPKYMGEIPHDKNVNEGWPDYRYAVSSDRKQYVVAAKMKRSDNPAFQSSKTGTILGCSCGSPWYCQEGASEGMPSIQNQAEPDTTTANFRIGKTEAIRIAKEAGLEEGIKPWKVNLQWSEIDKVNVWIVENTLFEQSKGFGDYRASGRTVIINATGLPTLFPLEHS